MNNYCFKRDIVFNLIPDISRQFEIEFGWIITGYNLKGSEWNLATREHKTYINLFFDIDDISVPDTAQIFKISTKIFSRYACYITKPKKIVISNIVVNKGEKGECSRKDRNIKIQIYILNDKKHDRS